MCIAHRSNLISERRRIMSKRQRLINLRLKEAFPLAVKGEGIYLYDSEGQRYLDGCSGALVANIGHRVGEIGRAMASQAETLSFVYRNHFSSPAAEALADRFCRLTREPMGGVYFTSSGSEATETAVKLARVRHLAAGEKDRHKIISRWQSYHGITMGALSWSGLTSRRIDYQPYLKDCVHIPPAYCYRCWFGSTPDSCALECAHALENAILTEGPDTVSAFMAEPVVGAALAAASPPNEYFQIIRDICNRYGVLYIAEEVMTGAGRTGKKFFASDHFPAQPDIIAFGKGVGGGYYPLAGALVSPDVFETICSGSGSFAASQSHSGHPVGMAAGLAVLDYMDQNNLLAHAQRMGQYLGQKLSELLARPLVGDVRGKGLMWGLEFVRDKATRATFDPELQVHSAVYEAARKKGLLLLPSGGCDRGHAGDMVLIGPPLIITPDQIDELVGTLGEALRDVEQKLSI
jgi:adenosylmethionine-8-amino-7-oxononanoate aminotransferase